MLWPVDEPWPLGSEATPAGVAGVSLLEGSGQFTTGNSGKPSRGAMHSFASDIHIVAHTEVHGSAISRAPWAGLILGMSGLVPVSSGLRPFS